MAYLELFQMPKPMKITGRSSSITNSFINSIIPVVFPTEEQVRKALEILQMTPETFECIYCGAFASEWDHLRPLVREKKPTGYISEIHNLVPACGKCNQSKGNKEWKDWMLSTAALSPSSKCIEDIPERIRRLEAYDAWCEPTRMDFEKIAGKEIWHKHWDNCSKIQDLMREAQLIAEQIKKEIAYAHDKL